MSRTFHLSCQEARLYLWIGQSKTAGSELGFVYGTRESLDKMRRFLIATQGKPLICVDSERESDECVEFEPD